MMHKYSHYKSTTSMIDMFMLLTVGFVILFVLAFILIKPVKPFEEEIPLEDQLMIRLDWEGTLDIDLDIWLLAPNGDIVSFKSKDKNGIVLERDDRGYYNELVPINGENKPLSRNFEVIRIAEVQDGIYYVTVQFYSKRVTKEDMADFSVEVYEAKTHKVIAINTDQVVLRGEVGIMAIEIRKGKVYKVTKHDRMIANVGTSGPRSDLYD